MVVAAAVVDVVAESVVVVDGEVMVVASAAGELEEAAEVEGGAGGMVVTIGTSVLVTEDSRLTGLAGSTGTAGSLTPFPERSAEAADEPHAAVPVNTNSTSTAICSLFTRLTLWLRQRLSPPPRKGPV